MSQSADAYHRHAVSQLQARLFQRAVDSEPGAEQRRGLFRLKLRRYFSGVVGRSFQKFGEAAIHRTPGDLLLAAQHLAPFQAVLAFTATPMEPRDPDPVADRMRGHVRA